MIKREKWRRAWDLNPRYFRMPVFKTGALGRYASPPWERLPDFRASEKSKLCLGRGIKRVSTERVTGADV
jgi:hypothetical protein